MVIQSELLAKRADKRRKLKKGPNEILASSSDEEQNTYFHGSKDLKYANLSWDDIRNTRLGRQIEDRITLLKGEIKNLDHKLKQSERQHKLELDRKQHEMQVKFACALKENIGGHLEKFKDETKKLRV